LFSLAQTILSQLLTAKNTAPERLSESEMNLAKRICHCVKCSGFWVRMKGKLPERCPKCHSREWDRPFLTALVNAQERTTPDHAPSTLKNTNGGTH
jgi:predicted Zn-ribbon and HTH transcriptional regulator